MMKFENQYAKSLMQTNHCVKCFKKIETNSLRFLLGNYQILCKNCLNERKPKFEKSKIYGYELCSIYEYDDIFRSTLFQIKGCGDIALAGSILNPYEKEISLWFKGYVLVPAPSYIDDDEARGFNHVEEIFRSLNLEIQKIFVKKKRIKQSDLSSKERSKVINNLEVKNSYSIYNKKLLIVDDVMTTGSTVKAMITLLEAYKPKKIKVLVCARTSLPKKGK